LFRAEAEYGESIVQSSLGNAEASVAALRRLLAIKPDHAPALMSVGSVEYQMGRSGAGALWATIGGARIASGFLWGLLSDRLGRKLRPVALVCLLQGLSCAAIGSPRGIAGPGVYSLIIPKQYLGPAIQFITAMPYLSLAVMGILVLRGISTLLIGCGAAVAGIIRAAVLLWRLLAFADRQYGGGMELEG
jgi:MFS family permease